MEQINKHNTLSGELVELAQKIEDVKRTNWSLSDETIEAYLIGKNVGKDKFVNTVINSYVNKLNKIQDSVETIYAKLTKSQIDCKKVFVRMNPMKFSVVFVINDDDFHNKDKRKLCYSTSKSRNLMLDETEMLTTFRFTCEENLDSNNLKLNGYNATFG